MRILNIITQGECGGAQKNVLDIAIDMSHRGHAVFVATGSNQSNSDSWLSSELKKNNIPEDHLFSLNYLTREISPYSDIRSLFEIISLINKIQPHLVHVHSSKAGALVAIATLFVNIKSVYTVHGYVFLEGINTIKKFVYTFIERINASLYDHIILMSSKDIHEAIKAHVLTKNNYSLIPNGLDEDRVTSILSPMESRQYIQKYIDFPIADKILVGVIANLYHTKGIEYLIKSATRILEQFPNTLFIVIGDGELRPELEQLINTLSLQNKVFLPGRISDAYTLLKAFDLIVLPSIKEGFPYIILESTLAGIPIIATRVGAIPEMTTYIDSLTVIEPRNIEQLINAICDSFTTKKSYGFIFPDRYTLKKMNAAIADVYEQVTGRIPESIPLHPSFLITLPAYNQESVIFETITKISDYLAKNYKALLDQKKINLCVAVNGTTDNTVSIIKMMQQKIDYLSFTESNKSGRGQALDKTWSKSKEDILIYIDSDLAYSLSDLGSLLNSYLNREEFDLVCASRRLKGSCVKRSLVRKILTEGYNTIIKLLFYNRFTDAQAGCKSITRRCYQNLRGHLQGYDGWFWDTALLLYAEKSGMKIKDIEITCIDNRPWRLKIIGTVLYFLKHLFKLRFKTLNGWMV